MATLIQGKKASTGGIFRRRKGGNPLWFYLLAGFTALISAAPVLWLVFTSLKPAAEIYGWPPSYLPLSPTLDNYRQVLASPNILRYILNSFLVSGSTTVLILLAGGGAAYALSRLEFRGRNLLLVLFLAASMFPTMAVVPALFIIFRQLGLINTYAGIILAHTALFLPLGIWIMATYFRSIPVEVEESAILDGCSPIRLMLNIVFPMSIPGLISAGLIVFMYSWNEFILSLILLSEDRMRTAVVGISLFPGEFAFPWETISVATVLAIIPPLFIFLFFQRYIVGGLTAGASKL